MKGGKGFPPFSRLFPPPPFVVWLIPLIITGFIRPAVRFKEISSLEYTPVGSVDTVYDE